MICMTASVVQWERLGPQCERSGVQNSVIFFSVVIVIVKKLFWQRDNHCQIVMTIFIFENFGIYISKLFDTCPLF